MAHHNLIVSNLNDLGIDATIQSLTGDDRYFIWFHNQEDLNLFKMSSLHYGNCSFVELLVRNDYE